MIEANFPNETGGRNSLRVRDPEANFLTCFLETRHAKACMVMDIFSSEIATIPYTVSSALMGMIRLQWWRDEIGKLYEYPAYIPAAPLLSDLQKVIAEYHIPHSFFEGILAAYAFEMHGYEDANDKRAIFLDYINTAHVPLIVQKARMIGEGNETDILSLAQSYAVIRILKSVAFAAAHGRCVLPDIPVSAISPASPVLQKSIGGWVEFAEALCAATAHPETRYIRAHAALIRLYCQAWKAAEYDPFRLTPIPFKELRVWWRSR